MCRHLAMQVRGDEAAAALQVEVVCEPVCEVRRQYAVLQRSRLILDDIVSRDCPSTMSSSPIVVQDYSSKNANSGSIDRGSTPRRHVTKTRNRLQGTLSMHPMGGRAQPVPFHRDKSHDGTTAARGDVNLGCRPLTHRWVINFPAYPTVSVINGVPDRIYRPRVSQIIKFPTTITTFGPASSSASQLGPTHLDSFRSAERSARMHQHRTSAHVMFALLAVISLLTIGNVDASRGEFCGGKKLL